MEKDKTLFGQLAHDTEKHQNVVILYIWENVFADGTFTYAKVVGRDDCKVYSTDFRNLVHIECVSRCAGRMDDICPEHCEVVA